MADDAQIERIRTKLVDFISGNPEHPDAAQARRILGKLPKVSAGTNDTRLLRPKQDIESVPADFHSDVGLDVGGTLSQAFHKGATKTAERLKKDVPGAINSVADRASFGLFGAAMRAAGRAGVPTTGEAANSIETYREDNPTLSQFTDAPAYLAPSGPAARLATGIERALPAATTALGRMGRAGIASGATSAVIRGSESAAEGNAPTDVLLDAGEAGLGGLAAGSTLAGGGELLRAGANAALRSPGGKARKFLEDRGVEVGVTTPGRGGPMDSMVAKGTTDEDIGRQGAASAEKALDMLNTERRAVTGAAGRQIARVSASPEGRQLRDVTDLVARMREAADDIGTAPDVSNNLKLLAQKIEGQQGKGFNPDVDNYFLAEGDLNAVRQQLDRFAKTGASSDAKLSPLKQAAGNARAMVNEGPLAEPNAQYAREAERYKESRRLLGVKPKSKTPDEHPTAGLQQRIIRKGQNTVTAGKDEADLAEFSKRHPDIGAELDRPEILRKRADISFGILPEHGGLLNYVKHGGHAPLYSIPGLLLRNKAALAARLLYGPAQAVAGAEPLYLEGVPQLSAPLLEAARRSQEKP